MVSQACSVAPHGEGMKRGRGWNGRLCPLSPSTFIMGTFVGQYSLFPKSSMGQRHTRVSTIALAVVRSVCVGIIGYASCWMGEDPSSGQGSDAFGMALLSVV